MTGDCSTSRKQGFFECEVVKTSRPWGKSEMQDLEIQGCAES